MEYKYSLEKIVAALRGHCVEGRGDRLDMLEAFHEVIEKMKPFDELPNNEIRAVLLVGFGDGSAGEIEGSSKFHLGYKPFMQSLGIEKAADRAAETDAINRFKHALTNDRPESVTRDNLLKFLQFEIEENLKVLKATYAIRSNNSVVLGE